MNTSLSEKIDPYSVPLDQVDVSDPGIYQRDEHWEYFRRLKT